MGQNSSQAPVPWQGEPGSPETPVLDSEAGFVVEMFGHLRWLGRCTDGTWKVVCGVGLELGG